MTQQSCPGSEKLRSFVKCSVSEQESQSISEHLEQCPACDETVVGLERDSDTIAERIRRAAAQPSYSHEPECQQILASLLDRALPAEEDVSTAGAPLPAAESLRDYRIVAKLGEGGMGTVYKAVHQRLKKTVALKVLPTRRIGDEPALARFAREMEVLGQLNHPNIVQALDAGEHDGQHYLVMEYVEGWDLSELLKRRSPLPIADACELISQAAIGLQYAHENGFVHRDIKPSNLMLARPDSRTRATAPTVKILDLGLARVLDQQAEAAAPREELTSTGQVMGTLDYMAPEQGGDAHQVDIRADIYSLGATFYKLLTGDSPFAEYAKYPPLQRLIAIAQNDPPNIRTKRPEVPKALAAIIHRMLAKNPDDRFDTPADLVTALTSFCHEADLAALWNAASGAEPGAANALAGRSRLATSREASRALTQARTSAQAQPSGSGSRTGRRWPIVAAAAAFLTFVALGVFLSIRTPHGEILVELGEGVLPESVKIEVSGDGAAKIADAAHGWQIQVKEGKYAVSLQGGGDHLKLDKDTVSVARNGQQVVRVVLKANVASTTGGPRSTPSIKPGPWEPGPNIDVLPGLIARPARLPGVKRWQAMTTTPNSSSDTRWSRDGKWLAVTSSSARLVRTYQIVDGRAVLARVIPGHGAFTDLHADWGPDDQLAVSTRGRLEIWNVAAGRRRTAWQGEERQLGEVAWSPDGKWIVLGDNGRLGILNVENGQLRNVDKGAHDLVSWAPDSKRLVSKNHDKTRAHIWNLDGTLEKEFETITGGFALSWSPKGDWIAVGGSYEVRLFKPTGEPGPVLKGNNGGVTQLSWSADGSQLVSSSSQSVIHSNWTSPVSRAVADIQYCSINPVDNSVVGIDSYEQTNALAKAVEKGFELIAPRCEATTVSQMSPDVKRLLLATNDRLIVREADGTCRTVFRSCPAFSCRILASVFR